MAAMAYSSAVNTRVGNELGAGSAAAAKLAYSTCLLAVVLLQVCIAVVAFLCSKQILAVLTNNQQVASLAIQVFPLLVATFVGRWWHRTWG